MRVQEGRVLPVTCQLRRIPIRLISIVLLAVSLPAVPVLAGELPASQRSTAPHRTLRTCTFETCAFKPLRPCRGWQANDASSFDNRRLQRTPPINRPTCAFF